MELSQLISDVIVNSWRVTQSIDAAYSRSLFLICSPLHAGGRCLRALDTLILPFKRYPPRNFLCLNTGYLGKALNCKSW